MSHGVIGTFTEWLGAADYFDSVRTQCVNDAVCRVKRRDLLEACPVLSQGPVKVSKWLLSSS